MKENDAVYTENVYRMPFTGKFNLIPFGDIHLNSPNHGEDSWNDFLSKSKRDNENNIYLCMGDEHDMASHSEREKLYGMKLHDSTIERLDDIIALACLDFCDMISFMRGKMMGFIQGNHYWVFQGNSDKFGYKTGETSTQYIARLMNAPWLGYLAYIIVKGCYSAKSNCWYRMDIVACHGRAGGKLVGTAINQVADMKNIFPRADIYIQGHNHQKGVWPDTHLVCNDHASGCISTKHHSQLLCRSGSFLKSYVSGKQSYPVAKLMKPSELGTIKIEVIPRRWHKDKREFVGIELHGWT